MAASKPSSTEMCVRCLKRRAVSHCGHVLDGKRMVTAGWCGKCLKNHAGFLGHWRPEMNPTTPTESGKETR